MNVYQVKRKRKKRMGRDESEHSFREFCCKEKQRNGEGLLAGRWREERKVFLRRKK